MKDNRPIVSRGYIVLSYIGIPNEIKGLFGTCFRFLFWFRDFLLYWSWNFNPDLNSRL